MEDLRYGDCHPNGINVGNTFYGKLYAVIPTIVVLDENHWRHTSEVKDVERVTDTEFKVYTRNSIYKLTVNE